MDVELNNFSSRLAAFVDANFQSRRQFAEDFGIQNATICTWINGERTPNLTNIANLCDKYNLSADWLIRGQGIAPNLECKKTRKKVKIPEIRSNKRHGLSKTKLYHIWHIMKQKCFNPNYPGYERYGEKGITMCEEWDIDFTTFHEWAMANGYEEGKTVKMIDPNGNYEPSNCELVWKNKILSINATISNKNRKGYKDGL